MPALALSTVKMAAVLLRNDEGRQSDCTTFSKALFYTRSFYDVFFNSSCLFVPLNLRSFVLRLTPFGGLLAFIEAFLYNGNEVHS